MQPRRPGHDPGPVDVKFVVIKVTLRQGFPPSTSLYPVSINPPMLHIHLHLFVSDGQARERLSVAGISPRWPGFESG